MTTTTTDDTLPRTIEIKFARVYTTGKLAGVIEIPMILGDVRHLDFDLDELYLHVEGEEHLLRVAGRAYFDGGLQLTFFSKFVRQTGQFPQGIQLHWGDIDDSMPCGMELLVRENPEEGR